MKFVINLIFICFNISTSLANEISFDALGRPCVRDLNNKNVFYGEGVYSEKFTYGMRKNAVVSAFVANKTTFSFPVLGFNSINDFSRYQDRDSVALYAENNSPPFKSWEKILSPMISGNKIISSSIDEHNIKPGMIIETGDNPKFVTYILSVSKGEIIDSGWINMRNNKLETPIHNDLLTVNPITKIWAANFNIIIPDDGRVSKGVIQENGIINNKDSVKANGIDTVVLPQSRSGGDIAYIARSTINGYAKRWNSGFVSIGNKFSFVSKKNKINSPYVSFLEDSNAMIGLQFNGENKSHSIIWKNKNNAISASISPMGNIEKIGYKTCAVQLNRLEPDCGRYIIDTKKNSSISLPDEKSLDDGYTLKITNISNSFITFYSLNKFSINNHKKYKMSASHWNMEAIYFNKKWIIQ